MKNMKCSHFSGVRKRDSKETREETRSHYIMDRMNLAFYSHINIEQT